MPEDTKSLKTGVLSPDEFLEQARITAAENLRQYQYVLDRFSDGLLFYYFGHVDQVSHMMWRAMDPGHPAYTAADWPYRSVDRRSVRRHRHGGGRDAGPARSRRPAGGHVGSRVHVMAPFVQSEQLAPRSWLPRRSGQGHADRSRVVQQRGLDAHARLRTGAQRSVYQCPGPGGPRHRRSRPAARARVGNRESTPGNGRSRDRTARHQPGVSAGKTSTSSRATTTSRRT